MDNELSARRHLGQLVRHERRRAGYSDTREWAAKVGRSDRQLLGLERGEKVGNDTYAAVAEALGWPLDRIQAILDGHDSGSASTALADVSDDDLVGELRRRLTRAGGGGHAERRGSAPIAGRERPAREPTVRQLEERLRRQLEEARTDAEREQLERMLSELQQAREMSRTDVSGSESA